MNVPSLRRRTVSKRVIVIPFADPGQNHIFFGLPVSRDNHPNRLAHSFRGGVPNISSAALFHEVMIPLRSLLTIASSEDSTTRARCRDLTSPGVCCMVQPKQELMPP